MVEGGIGDGEGDNIDEQVLGEEARDEEALDEEVWGDNILACDDGVDKEASTL